VNQARVSRVLGLGVIVLFVATAFTPLPDRLAQWIAIPEQVAPADAIVVLAGGGTSALNRVVRGITLSRRKLAPLLVLSGARTDAVPSEAQRRAALAREMGVVSDAILTVSDHTTRGEVAMIERLLRPRGISKIILVTSAQHMVRAKHLFERVGFEVLPAPTDIFSPPSRSPAHRLQLTRQTLQEMLARLYYRAAGYL
jgi:uncharacterized SAM-binding protein YcdF (DUF218 family)